MRVLIISGEDLSGGGHRAAFRLHRALRTIGVDSVMAVRRKDSSDPTVHRMSRAELGWPPFGRGYLDALPKFLCVRGDEPISLGLQTSRLDILVKTFAPDLINLHWINGGIVNIEAISQVKVPVIWTLHDMWPFTGGCHYAGDCNRYMQSCETCPKIGPTWASQLVTRWIYQRKRRHWSSRKIHAIAPSLWMRGLASQSSLFRNAEICHIPNCVDPQIYNSQSRESTRHALGLSSDTTAVLFSSANQARKGAFIVPELVALLRNSCPRRKWRFLFMGGMPEMRSGVDDVMLLPRTNDDEHLAGYYAASDFFVLPSREDNLPNTVSEALNCGTPVVAFRTGGIPEMVEAGHNGALADFLTSRSLADAILQLDSAAYWSRAQISRNASYKYSPKRIADLHFELFTKL